MNSRLEGIKSRLFVARVHRIGRDFGIRARIGVLRAEFLELQPVSKLMLACLSGWIGLVSLLTLAAAVSFELSTWQLPWLPGAQAPASPMRAAFKTYENIVRRPLFSRTRQGAIVVAPPPEIPQTVAAPSLEQGMVLKGVFISIPTAKAFVVSAQNPTGVWVQSGDDIGGWRVAKVTPGEVQLRGRGEQITLPLNVTGGAR